MSKIRVSRIENEATTDGGIDIDGSGNVQISGALGLGGATYGTAGQVLTSQGANAAPQWGAAAGGFDSGTAMLFQQTAAPTGWTKSTTHNNKALRVVSGTAGSGGSTNFDSVFGSSISTNAHTLTISQIPNHGHPYAYYQNYGFSTFRTTAAGYTTSVQSLMHNKALRIQQHLKVVVDRTHTQ